MSARDIDGKALAEHIRDEVAAEVASLRYSPGLAAVLVGIDPASHLYIRLKQEACAAAGIRFVKFLLPTATLEPHLLDLMDDLNGRDDVDAILLQLPLPPHLDPYRAVARIDPAKDADGFHPENMRAFIAGTGGVVPPLIAGINRLIASTGAPVHGRFGLLIAKGSIVADPLAKTLADSGITMSAAEPDDGDLAVKARRADVLVTIAGIPGLVTRDMVKPGAVVIDAGTNRVGKKIIGDAAPEVAQVASWITPVPGGVGPMTVAMLLRNVVTLAKARRAST